MSLRARQSRFVKMVALLIGYADLRGYQLTFGDCYRDGRCKYGHPKSLHRKRLAVDLNVFRDGIYLQGESARKAHEVLHDFWDAIGGNPRITSDLNHYSYSDGSRMR